MLVSAPPSLDPAPEPSEPLVEPGPPPTGTPAARGGGAA
jgi:hypothetical protein